MADLDETAERTYKVASEHWQKCAQCTKAGG